MTTLLTLAIIAGATAASLLLGAGILHLAARLGPAGRAFTAASARAPLLDVWITWFTALPMIVGAAVGGNMQLAGGHWRGAALGLLAGIAGQGVGATRWRSAPE